MAVETEKKTKVLLIDDEPSFTRLLRLNLEKTGAYEVREENKGSHGFETALQFKPDIILLDIIMPDIDGGTVVSQLRSSEQLQNTTVLFLTAVLSKRETHEKIGLLSSIPSIAKPVSAQEVIYFIERYTRK